MEKPHSALKTPLPIKRFEVGNPSKHGESGVTDVQSSSCSHHCSTEESPKFAFLLLPPEIRNRIYETLVATDDNTHYLEDMSSSRYLRDSQTLIGVRSSYTRKLRVWPPPPEAKTTYTLCVQSNQPLSLSIFRVIRQISREATDVLYSQRFSFAFTAMIVPFLKDRSPRARALIKALATRDIVKGEIDSNLWAEGQRQQFSRDWEQLCAYLAKNLDLEIFELHLASHCREFTNTSAKWIPQLIAIKGLKGLRVSFTVLCKLWEHCWLGLCRSDHREIAFRLRSFLQSQMLKIEGLKTGDGTASASQEEFPEQVKGLHTTEETRRYFSWYISIRHQSFSSSHEEDSDF